MKMSKVVPGFFAALLLMSAAAYADVIKGEIVSVNASSQTLVLKVSEGGKENGIKENEIINAVIMPDTQFEGALFKDFRTGDVLLADIFQGSSPDLWVAKRIQIDKINIRNIQEINRAAKR